MGAKRLRHISRSPTCICIWRKYVMAYGAVLLRLALLCNPSSQVPAHPEERQDDDYEQGSAEADDERPVDP